LVVGCTTSPVKKERISNPHMEDDYRIKSSGFIGCSPESIDVVNIVYSGAGSSKSWQAACKGKVFYCSQIVIGGDAGISSQVSCVESI